MKSKAAIVPSTREVWVASPATLVWGLTSPQAAILAAIVLATIAIYLPSLRNGWVFDDRLIIVDNKLIHNFWPYVWNSFRYDVWWFLEPGGPPRSAYYRPLENVWFAVNELLFGTHPAAWHLAKIVLHGFAVVLCFRLAQLITHSSAIALLSAAVFGLLPANVESVVWASAIPEPLSTIFEIGALCCFINRKPGWSRGLVFALILYAGALLSHETAILFWLIVAAYLFLIEARPARESMRLAAPFLMVAILYLCARLNALGASDFLGMPYAQAVAVSVGWARPVPPPGLLDFIFTAPVVLLTYVGVLMVPGIAGPAHDVRWIVSVAPITFIAAGLLAVLAAIAFAVVWRSSYRNLYLFCAAWSALTLAPSMKLGSIFALVQDRVLYAPSFGFSLAVATLAVQLAAISPRARTAVAGATALLLAAYALSAVRLEHYWHDDLTFYAGCVTYDPHNVEYLRALVKNLNEKGDLTMAMNALQNAVSLNPDNPYLHVQMAKQYAMMQRGADFAAEMAKTRALWARERAASAGVAPGNAATAIPVPR